MQDYVACCRRKNAGKKSQYELRVGQELDVEAFLAELQAMGYVRADLASTPGEFSVRGGIIDIYPLTEEHPLRIDLFDTEIDSMRYFNAEDQRSLEPIEQITIGPAEETILTEPEWQRAAENLTEQMQKSLKKK